MSNDIEHIKHRLADLTCAVEFLGDNLLQRIQIMATSLDALTAEVARNRDVTASAVALIGGFSARLDAAIAAAKAGDDSAQLDALNADLKTQADALAAAVAANTPAAPAAPTPPATTTP